MSNSAACFLAVFSIVEAMCTVRHTVIPVWSSEAVAFYPNGLAMCNADYCGKCSKRIVFDHLEAGGNNCDAVV